MAVRGSKSQSVDVRQVVPTLGLDLSQPPNVIGDNALTEAKNVWYEPSYVGCSTRGGIVFETPPIKGREICALCHYVEGDGTAHIVAATPSSVTVASAEIYELVEMEEGGKEWKRLFTLKSGTVPPSFLVFNGKLIIADNDPDGLSLWDGKSATKSLIAGSPSRPTVLGSVADRVVCNSLDTPDTVFFSGAKNYEDWDVSGQGTALQIPAGFGDGAEINGFAVMYQTLIVSKVLRDSRGNMAQKFMHMIKTSGEPSQWLGVQLSTVNAAKFQHSLISVGEQVYLLDEDEPKVLVPSPGGAYGDISTSPGFSPRILPNMARFIRNANFTRLVYVRSLAQLWFILRSGNTHMVAVYHPIQNAWTELHFGDVVPMDIIEAGQIIYMAGSDGALYRIVNASTDRLANGSESPVYSIVRSRLFDTMGGDIILRALKLTVGSILPAELMVEAVDGKSFENFLIAEFSTRQDGSADQKIYDANQYIDMADWHIFGGNAITRNHSEWRVAGPRKTGLYLQVRSHGGRYVFENITAQFAVTG